ncbi:MAG: RNA polymerase sigma factor [Spirochaetes bacterium]|jgi:RNA polymerase sigma-70 factor (ECF subfamily)|nr:RNA polymerase sigma factor [Spirochaetota bacterium]
MARRDAAGIGRFFKEEYRAMLAYVRGRIRDTAARDGEDIVQDVMLRLLEAPDPARQIENLAAYVYRALRNRVIDVVRGRRSERSLDAMALEGKENTLLDTLVDARINPVRDLDHAEIRQALFDAIDGLPDEQREALVLTEFEGWTFRELSEATGTPTGTLLARKSRALARIRKSMENFHNRMEE